MDVAAVLTIRLPPLVRTADETLTLVRAAYDAEGDSSGMEQETFTRRLEATAGDETSYDVFTRFRLPPGRHQVRFNAASRLADASGSLIVDVEVPDLSRAAPSMSSIVLGTVRSPEPDDPLAGLLPVVPTTARDFTHGDRITAFVRLFSGDTVPPTAVAVAVRVLDGMDREVLSLPAAAIGPDAFRSAHVADYSFDLPLMSLARGPHLASVTATFDGARLVRRDVVFRVR